MKASRGSSFTLYKTALVRLIWLTLTFTLSSQNVFADETRSVAAVMRGPEAPQILASALKALIINHPNIVMTPLRMASEITSAPDRCGKQQNGESLRPCTFFDAAIESEIWPSDAPQLQEIVKSTALRGGNFLPQVKVKIETSTISTVIKLAGAEITEEERRILCRRQRWSNTDNDIDCVIEVMPAFGLQSSSSSVRRVILRQRIIRLVIPNISASEVASVKETLRDTFIKNDTKEGSRAAVEEEITATPLSSPNNSTLCSASGLPSTINTIRKLMNWPTGVSQQSTDDESIAIVEHGMSRFADDSLTMLSNNINTSEWSELAISALRHPIFQSDIVPPWKLDCEKISIAPPTGPLAHTMAVASVVLGNTTSLTSKTVSNLSLTPFFGAGIFQIYSLGALVPIVNLSQNRDSQVVVASFQTSAPRPVTNFTIPKNKEYKVKHYRTTTENLNNSGKILVVAAPINNKEPEIELNKSAAYSEELFCTTWPACLDSMGLTLTVAAIKNNGELMLEDPGSKLPYELTNLTVSVAAPGENIPVAIADANGPSIALASGSSLAAPLVAAVALTMRSKLGRASESYDIISAIQATSDLSSNYDQKIRFGVVNAERAIQAASLPKKSAMGYELSTDERSDANSNGNIFKNVQGIERLKSCKVSENQAIRGVFVFYRINDPITNANGEFEPPQCIGVTQLLRIRQTEQLDSRRTYTIVYNDNRNDGSPTPYPRIERSVFLESSNEGASLCTLAYGDPEDVEKFKRPCLSGVDSNGARVPVSLINSDIAFQPSGWRERK